MATAIAEAHSLGAPAPCRGAAIYAATTASCDYSRRWLWRTGGGEDSGSRTSRRHHHRSAELSLLSAVALSGGDGGAIACRGSLADPPYSAPSATRHRVHGGSHQHRLRGARGEYQVGLVFLRLPHRRDRRDAFVFRS